MDDLISRQAVIDDLRKFKPEIIPYEKARIYVEETVETMYDRIVELPTIQPERAEGEWSDGYRWQRCSLCKQTGKRSWNYCPNCGAKMKGERQK